MWGEKKRLQPLLQLCMLQKKGKHHTHTHTHTIEWDRQTHTHTQRERERERDVIHSFTPSSQHPHCHVSAITSSLPPTTSKPIQPFSFFFFFYFFLCKEVSIGYDTEVRREKGRKAIQNTIANPSSSLSISLLTKQQRTKAEEGVCVYVLLSDEKGLEASAVASEVCMRVHCCIFVVSVCFTLRPSLLFLSLSFFKAVRPPSKHLCCDTCASQTYCPHATNGNTHTHTQHNHTPSFLSHTLSSPKGNRRSIGSVPWFLGFGVWSLGLLSFFWW